MKDERCPYKNALVIRSLFSLKKEYFAFPAALVVVCGLLFSVEIATDLEKFARLDHEARDHVA